MILHQDGKMYFNVSLNWVEGESQLDRVQSPVVTPCGGLDVKSSL